MNDNIDLKTQRVKGYFLEAAKQIILTEGIENISARKVADLAGYSYATIYNYFKDIDELLREAKSSMIMDIMKHMQDSMNFSPRNIEDVKKLLSSYVQYYLDHPHIYRFLYSYRLAGSEASMERYDFSEQWASALGFLVDAGRIKADEVENCAKTLIYAVQGLLALFFSGNGITEELLFTDLGKIIDFTISSQLS